MFELIRLRKWLTLYNIDREKHMYTNDLYISSINVAQTYYDWYHEARAFYKDCGGEMPNNWWERWVNVLGLRLVERGK